MDQRIDDMFLNVMGNLNTPNRQNRQNNQRRNQSAHSNRNTTNQNMSENTQSLRYVNRQLDTINNLIQNYNNNMNEYQRNIGLLATMVYSNGQLFRWTMMQHPQRTYNRIPTQGPYFTYSNIRRPMQTTFTPRVSISEEEINNIIRTFTYSEEISSSLNDTRCPISWQEYNNGDELCEINACGHVFLKSNLLRWLQRNNTCPTCRRQLRENPRPNTNMYNFFNDGTMNSIDLFSDSFWRDIQNIYNDLSGNEINVSIDISGNGIRTSSTTDFDNNNPDNASVD
jgi:hypothetical protein